MIDGSTLVTWHRKNPANEEHSYNRIESPENWRHVVSPRRGRSDDWSAPLSATDRRGKVGQFTSSMFRQALKSGMRNWQQASIKSPWGSLSIFVGLRRGRVGDIDALNWWLGESSDFLPEG
jgi:hypothetical protein